MYIQEIDIEEHLRLSSHISHILQYIRTLTVQTAGQNLLFKQNLQIICVLTINLTLFNKFMVRF